jgi:dolichol-phosphate mannosyltransferase
VGLIAVPELTPLGEQTPPRELAAADRSVIELVLKTTRPTLTITGPQRLPQARTNVRWTNSLAVPIREGAHIVGVVYATRNSTEPFTDEDLHWLTAYASTATPIFSQNRRA